MARKQEPPKPLFPLKHEYEASIKEVCEQAAMLLGVLRTVMDHPESVQKPEILKILKVRVAALEKAMYGDQGTM